jgi:nucleoside recognition membrane protein YjiH
MAFIDAARLDIIELPKLTDLMLPELLTVFLLGGRFRSFEAFWQVNVIW